MKNKNIKKLLVLMFVTLVIFSLTACGKKENTKVEEDVKEEADADTEEEVSDDEENDETDGDEQDVDDVSEDEADTQADEADAEPEDLRNAFLDDNDI